MKFQLIIGCLAALGLAVTGTTHAQDDAEQEAIVERLKPVGQLCREGEGCGTSEAASDDGDSDGGISGSDIYGSVCAACHDSGAAGAPVRGEEDQWTDRIDKGIETLYDHAINGFNAMPARGGDSNLSDDEVKAATNHLLDPLMDDLPEIGGGEEEATAEEDEASDSGAAEDEQDTAENGDETTAEGEEAASEGDEAASEGEEAASEDEEAASEGGDNGLDGESIYASAGCAACHDSGAAGAPVVGEADDWASRIDKGEEELYTNAIEGIGAMPPKGGNTSVSDDEVKAVVDYMIEAAE